MGVVGTWTSLLQAYQEQSCLLRRQSLRTPATPLLPGSMTEGRLPCKHTWSPNGSRSGNTPIRCMRLTLLPRWGGGANSPEVMSWTKLAQLDKLRSDRSFGKPPGGGSLSLEEVLPRGNKPSWHRPEPN